MVFGISGATASRPTVRGGRGRLVRKPRTIGLAASLSTATLLSAAAVAPADELSLPHAVGRSGSIEAIYRFAAPVTGRGSLEIEWTDTAGRVVERRQIPLDLRERLGGPLRARRPPRRDRREPSRRPAFARPRGRERRPHPSRSRRDADRDPARRCVAGLPDHHVADADASGARRAAAARSHRGDGRSRPPRRNRRRHVRPAGGAAAAEFAVLRREHRHRFLFALPQMVRVEAGQLALSRSQATLSRQPAGRRGLCARAEPVRSGLARPGDAAADPDRAVAASLPAALLQPRRRDRDRRPRGILGFRSLGLFPRGDAGLAEGALRRPRGVEPAMGLGLWPLGRGRADDDRGGASALRRQFFRLGRFQGMDGRSLRRGRRARRGGDPRRRPGGVGGDRGRANPRLGRL